MVIKDMNGTFLMKLLESLKDENKLDKYCIITILFIITLIIYWVYFK